MDITASKPAQAAPLDSVLDSALLSFTAAFVDTCGFIGLAGLFTAHVTGNFVLIGASLVNHSGEIAAKLLAFPVFVLGIVGTVLLARWLTVLRWRVAPGLLLLEAALLLVAMLEYAWLGSSSALVTGMILVSAMALQNALMRVALPQLPPTTVMTGNVTQVVVDLVTLALPGASDSAIRQRLRRMWPGIAAFTAGAASGALLYAWVGFACLAVPALTTLAAALRLARRTDSVQTA